MKKARPIHPGTILLEDFMRPLRLSQNHLASELRVPTPRIGEIVNGRRSITAETALRLGRYFNTGAAFWMNLQQHYDLQRAEDEHAKTIAREIKPRPPESIPA